MYLLQEFRARSRHVVGPLLGILAIGYFAFHVVHGERGLLAWLKIKQRVAAAKQAGAASRDERETLERRVRLMEPGSLDPDMIEERARLMINYGHEDEIVILDERLEDQNQKRRK